MDLYNMPKLPKDFQKSVIYRIACRDLEIKDCYVGSTTNLSQRKKSHKSECKLSHVRVYTFIREHGGWDNWEVVLVEAYPCANIDELLARERHHVERLGATLNSRVPSRTLKEWGQQNREVVLKHKATYREGHRDEIKASTKERYVANQEHNKEKITCECGRMVARYAKGVHSKSTIHIQLMAALNPDVAVVNNVAEGISS